MTASVFGDLTFEDMLALEEDGAILDFRCTRTGLVLWPQVRVIVYRMLMSDILFGVELTGKSLERKKPLKAVLTLARSAAHNFRFRWAGRCRAPICVFGDGVANQWVGGRVYNRLVDDFVAVHPNDTLVIEDHFEWIWPFPRYHEGVMLHSPRQAMNSIEGRLFVREHHWRMARQLITLICQRAQHYFQWSPGQARFDRLVEMLAKKAASMPMQYAAYQAMLGRVRPRLLMVGCACYGPHASLIAAAKSQGIVTAEYQHGAISKGHDAYNFARVICESADYRRTLPDYFLSYGDWWNEQINAPVTPISIGSPHRAMRASGDVPSIGSRNDLLILSDGIRFDHYLELARRLCSFAASRGLRVVLRPHPLERTKVSIQSRFTEDRVWFDENVDVYSSLRTAYAVISEVSTVLFEAIGSVKHIFVWNTPRARFVYPTHPFQAFDSTSMLIELLEQDRVVNLDGVVEDAFWADEWRDRYSRFLKSLGALSGD